MDLVCLCLDCIAVNNEIVAYLMVYLVVLITTYAIVVRDCLTTSQVAMKVHDSSCARVVHFERSSLMTRFINMAQ